MKKIALITFLTFLFLVGLAKPTSLFAQEKLEVNFFWGQGCPHCEKAKVFLSKMQEKYPDIVINSYEIYTHPENQKLFQEFGQKYDIEIKGVPMIFIGENVHKGYRSDSSTGKKIEACIKDCLPEIANLDQKKISGEIKSNLPEGTVAIQDEKNKSAPLTFTKIISLALADAVNPCAMAVLSLMLIAILTYNPQKKEKILWAGLAFTFSVFLTYIFYGLVIIKIFQLIQALSLIRFWLYKLLGAGAIVLGILAIKDFVKNKGKCKTVPRINKFIHKVTSPKGAFLIGFFVTIFLLPCTIGPYIVAGGILSEITILKTLPWLLLYNLIFVLPMLLITVVVYLGVARIQDVTIWEAKYMKYLHLAAGLVMLGLGVLMLLGLL